MSSQNPETLSFKQSAIIILGHDKIKNNLILLIHKFGLKYIFKIKYI